MKTWKHKYEKSESEKRMLLARWNLVERQLLERMNELEKENIELKSKKE